MGIPGKVMTRRAACHKCASCWGDDPYHCENKAYVGLPAPILITKKTMPASGAARMERAALNREGLARSEKATVGSIICVETHDLEQSIPWVIGTILEPTQAAPAASPPYDSTRDSIHFEPVKANEPVLKVQLYEGLEPGSSTYVLSDVVMLVPARRVRVIDVELQDLRSSARAAATRARFKIDDDSLQKIRAEMPTTSDDWEVEAVVQYRVQYGVQQWYVKWKGYGDDRNTWEPWENLLTPELQAEAKAAKEAALPHDEAGLNKVTVPFLKEALEARGLATAGRKAELVQRLLAALSSE